MVEHGCSASWEMFEQLRKLLILGNNGFFSYFTFEFFVWKNRGLMRRCGVLAVLLIASIG